MLVTLIFLGVCFLAYSNGANDNFKGVASLFGSRTCDYRTAISWATVATFAGSVTALFLAQALLQKFSGKGLVPDALVASPQFVLAVAFGAGATVILATLLGFPISKEMCVCVGVEQQVLPLPQPSGVFAAQTLPTLSVTVDNPSACAQRYTGSVLGMNAGRLLDSLHFLSAGAVSFARGLNDTPKVAALLFVASGLDIRWGLLAAAVAMGVGGLLNARRVAETMSHKITGMNPGQGFAANLSTALLVTTASMHGLPVSTTHVSVGSLLGMGIVTGQAKWKPVLGVLASWVVTLPGAALLSGAAYWLGRSL